MATAAIAPLLHAAQTGLSAYAAYYSYISIRAVRTYERPAEKAAKWSNVAEDQLWAVRKTQASGAAAVLLSFLTSIYLLASPTHRAAAPVLSVVAAAASFAARTYIARFWEHKAKVPGVGQFNEAISTTNRLKDCLGCLGLLWGVGAVVAGWVG